MATITSIKPQKSKKDRLNIFLDGKFAFSLPAETLVKAGLHEGLTLTNDQVQELVKQNEFSLVFDKVLRFLSFRPRSEFEISEYMLRKGVGEETRKMVISRLKKLQLIDDDAFTKWWIEQRSNCRPAGRSLLKFELRRKGISREKIDELVAQNRSNEGDKLLAEKIAKRKLERLKNLPVLEVKRKLYSALMMRGFNGETAREVIEKLLKEE